MSTSNIHVSYPYQLSPDDAVDTVASDEWRAALELHGELDIADAPQLRASLDEHIEAGRRVVRVDMQAVTFVDSTILGVLCEAHQRCVDRHVSLILTGVHGVVARVIKLTGLDQVLLIDTASDPV